MFATALVFALYAALAVVGSAVLLLPIYFWVLHRDSVAAPSAAEALAEADSLLRAMDSERSPAR